MAYAPFKDLGEILQSLAPLASSPTLAFVHLHYRCLLSYRKVHKKRTKTLEKSGCRPNEQFKSQFTNLGGVPISF